MKWKISLAVVLIFVAGSVTGFIIRDNLKGGTEFNYAYLAKRIQIDNPNSVKINFTTLRQELNSYVANLPDDLKDKVNVYYEYLPSGVTININENNESVAASLMKLPVIMNLYKASEVGAINLDSSVTLKKEWLNSEYGDLYKKGEGYSISLREAAKLTLINSDNTALLASWDAVESSKLSASDTSLYYLDVEYNVKEDESVIIGAKSYSSILKCLYFACFNSKDDSNEILKYLTESSFNDRLTRYLPSNVMVAHKIGTYSEKFQSDCGIVYAPKENYIICVMVEGKDPAASQIIADISQKAYLFTKSVTTNE